MNQRLTFLRTLLFTAVALLSFAVWANFSRLFQYEWQLYTGCAVIFFFGGGLALIPGAGLQTKNSRIQFLIRFALGFLCYAVIWSVAWFTFRNTFGEVLGSFFGLMALLAIITKHFSFPGRLIDGIAVVFLWHTIGYYAGEIIYEALQNRGPLGFELPGERRTAVLLARFGWGLGYGAGMGYGLSRWIQLSRQA